jgi:hypothetical protein
MAGETRRRTWLPFAGIILASALAHLWCLGSQFYLDDHSQILESEIVRSGQFLAAPMLAWTNLGYVIQSRIFGFSPLGFHAVNWLLHTAVACVLFGFGREFIREKWPAGVALFGALLFAVHPLASEIPNYVRTQDLAWVTLFSLLAAWAMLGFLRGGGWHKILFCGLAVGGAAISKGPGLFHAMMAVAAVGLAFAPPAAWGTLHKKWWLPAGGLAGVAVVAWSLGLADAALGLIHRWHEPRFIGHAYTLARVFWEFAWRAVIPVSLCSDHQIAETLIPPGTSFLNIPDKGAMVAMAAFLAFTGFSVFLAWRKSTRLFGVCLTLFVATILFRFLYLIPEFMPEYRIYPGLPWFCLCAAIALTGAWKWLLPHVSPRVPAAILLASLALLSAKRSFVWHDLDRLMADVLKQYPAQGRAVWELHDRDLAAGNWQAVIDRQEQVWPQVRQEFITRLGQLAPARELPTGHFSLAEIACMGHYARAVAHRRNPAEAIRLINQLEAYMRAMKIEPRTNPAHWNLFARDKALVLETSGNYQAALDTLKPADQPPAWPRDYERIAGKLAAKPRP